MDTFTLGVDTPQILNIFAKRSVPTGEDINEETIRIISDIVENAENALMCARHRGVAPTNLSTLVWYDNSKHLVIVEDTGIGMSKSHLISYLGVVGRSGTKNFRDSIQGPIVPQFYGALDGISFYSLFLISDKIQVYSISSSEERIVHKWEWTEGQKFTIEVDHNHPLNCGTQVMIFLKEERRAILADNTFREKLVAKWPHLAVNPVGAEPTMILPPDQAPDSTLVDPHEYVKIPPLLVAYEAILEKLRLTTFDEVLLSQNQDKNTVLHCLFSRSHIMNATGDPNTEHTIGTIRTLADIIKNADPENQKKLFSLKNNDGKTIMHLAVEKSNQIFVEVLISCEHSNSKEIVGQNIQKSDENQRRSHFFNKYFALPIEKATWTIVGQDSRDAQRMADGLDPEAFDRCPDKGRNILHLALKSGNGDMIALLRLKGFEFSPDKHGNTTAHFVTMSGNFQLFQEYAGNIDNFFHATTPQSWPVNLTGDTLLHTAATFGHNEFIVYFLSIGMKLEAENKRGLTPLHCAARSGRTDTVVLLVAEFGANVNAQTESRVNPLFLAAKHHHFDMMQFLLNWGANANAVNRTQNNPLKGAIEKIMDKPKLISVVKSLIQYGANVFIKKADPEIAIKILEWVADFPIYNPKDSSHIAPDQNRMPFAMITLLKFHPNPTTFLNSKMENLLFRLHETECGPQLIGQLLLFSIAIQDAMESHPLEEIYLQKRFDEIDDIIVKCMDSPIMDDHEKFITMMCTNPSNGKLPRCALLHTTPTIGDSEDEHESHQSILSEGKITSDAKRLMFSDGPLRLCMDYQLSAFCGTLQVASISNVAFRDHMKDVYNYSFNDYFSLSSFKRQMILDFRSKPILMFFLEGLSKLVMLILCAFISIHVYQDTSNFDHESRFYPSEKLLIIMWITFTLHEIGQIYDTWNFFQYFSWVWNKLDWAMILLIFIWLVCRKGNENSFLVAKCALSLASIPGALNLLRYLSLHKSSGVLVIMIMRLGFDLSDFLLIFFFGIVGFGVALMGLFSDKHIDYPNIKETFYTLFSSGLGNFDLTALTGPYKDVGKILLICYVLFVAVLLLNLLIARMADTHTRIDNRAFQEWSLTLAKNADNFMLLKERCPLSMLPPPLNLIPTSMIFLHLIWCRKAVYFGTKDIHRSKSQIKSRAAEIRSDPNYKIPDLSSVPTFTGEKFTISYPGTISDAVVHLLCFPFWVLLLIPIHIIEFCLKLAKEEGLKAFYIAPVGIPWVICLTLYHSTRILIASLQHATVLKLDPYGQTLQLDIEHEEIKPPRPWYHFQFANYKRCTFQRPHDGPLLPNRPDPSQDLSDHNPDQDQTQAPTEEISLANWFLEPQVWNKEASRGSTSTSTHHATHNDPSHPKKYDQWFSSEELRRIFKDHIPSRYPPNSSSVDDVMNVNIKNIMSKMRDLRVHVPAGVTPTTTRPHLDSFDPTLGSRLTNGGGAQKKLQAFIAVPTPQAAPQTPPQNHPPK